MRLLQLVGSPVDDFHADLSRLYAGGCLQALGERYEMSTGVRRPWRFVAVPGDAATVGDSGRPGALPGCRPSNTFSARASRR